MRNIASYALSLISIIPFGGRLEYSTSSVLEKSFPSYLSVCKNRDYFIFYNQDGIHIRSYAHWELEKYRTSLFMIFEFSTKLSLNLSAVFVVYLTLNSG